MKGCIISHIIGCGVDLIRVSIKESLSGFKDFLHKNNTSISRIHEKSYGYEFSFNIDGIGYDGESSNGIRLTMGGLREYKHTSRSEKRWKFLQYLYQNYSGLKITELHFAIDLPYWYSDITIAPKKYLKNLKQYPSTKYFDRRRKSYGGDVNGKDNIVIYDKSYKCKLSHPITRIEQRLSSQHLQDLKDDNKCIITDESAQLQLRRKINFKFSDMIVKKGRLKLDLITICDKAKAIITAMEYVRGDSSLLEVLMSHRTSEVAESSELFSSFISECERQNVKQNKPQRSKKMQPYLKSLSPNERTMLNQTVRAYKYNSTWNEIIGKPKKRVRLAQEDTYKALFLYETGSTQAGIAKELGVSESRISRLFSKEGFRSLKNSHYKNMFQFGSLEQLLPSHQ